MVCEKCGKPKKTLKQLLCICNLVCSIFRDKLGSRLSGSTLIFFLSRVHAYNASFICREKAVESHLPRQVEGKLFVKVDIKVETIPL